MNVLLLSPSIARDTSKTKWLSPNIGIWRIAGLLRKHGHRAECYDQALHQATGKGPGFEEKLAERDWDFVGFSVLEESLPSDITNMHLVGKLSPGATIVAGGIEAQYSYQTILEKSPCRICVMGEGERPMLEIVNGTPLQDIPGIVLRNPANVQTADEFWEVSEAMPFEVIPYEDYWDHYRDLYGESITPGSAQAIHTVRIFTRNYCPVGCKFCTSTNQLSDAAGVRRAKVVDIIDDRLVGLIGRIMEAHPRVETIYFTDDDFAANLGKVRAFCEKIIDSGIKTSFICFARADKIDEKTMALMARAGFRVINMGLESFSKAVWDEFGKRYNYDKVIRNLDLFKTYGITPFVSVILCGPEATIPDVELTARELLKHLDAGGIEAGVNISVQPFRGSRYSEEEHDFEVEVMPIPETRFFYKREYFIRAKDPEVRELQYRFLERYPDVIRSKSAAENIKHATSSAQSRIKLDLMLELIEEIKSERSDPTKSREKRLIAESVTRGLKAIHRLAEYRSGSAL